jgi:hypothetical protein
MPDSAERHSGSIFFFVSSNLAGWLAGWLASWLLGWLAGWLAGGIVENVEPRTRSELRRFNSLRSGVTPNIRLQGVKPAQVLYQQPYAS